MTGRSIASRWATLQNKKRWKGVSEEARSAVMRAVVMQRWHDSECERSSEFRICRCKERRKKGKD